MNQTSYLFRNNEPSSAAKEKALLLKQMRQMQQTNTKSKTSNSHFNINSGDSSSYGITQQYFGKKDIRQSLAMPPGAARLSVDSSVIKSGHFVTSNNFNSRAQSQIQMNQDLSTDRKTLKSQTDNDYGEMTLTSSF